jgi:hypothetical protein
MINIFLLGIRDSSSSKSIVRRSSSSSSSIVLIELFEVVSLLFELLSTSLAVVEETIYKNKYKNKYKIIIKRSTCR